MGTEGLSVEPKATRQKPLETKKQADPPEWNGLVGEVLRGGGKLYMDGGADGFAGACAGLCSPVVLVIKRTSTRRFLARPSDVLFDSTGLSLPKPIREILWAGTLCSDARY